MQMRIFRAITINLTAIMATPIPLSYLQVAQLSQRDCTAGLVSYGQKWKTGTGR